MEFGITPKGNGILVGMDAFQCEEIDTHLTPGRDYKCVITEARNYRNLCRYMKFISDVFKMQEHYTTKEHLREYLQLRAGHMETIVMHDGRTFYRSLSVSYKECKDEEFFRDIFQRVRTAAHDMLNEMGRNLTEDEFNQLVSYD